jgi:hypothetical protein
MHRVGAMVAIAVAIVLGSSRAEAAIISFDFTLTASEGSATGTFSGEDLDTSGFLTAGELTSLAVTATGTAFTGGPIVISQDEARVFSFNFQIATMDLLSLQVTNGVGKPVFEQVFCDPLVKT